MKWFPPLFVLVLVTLVTGCPGPSQGVKSGVKHARYEHVSRVVRQKVIKHAGPFGGVWTEDSCYVILCECPETKEVKELRLWKSEVVADVPPGGALWAEAYAEGHLNRYGIIHVHSLDDVSSNDSEIHVHGVD